MLRETTQREKETNLKRRFLKKRQAVWGAIFFIGNFGWKLGLECWKYFQWKAGIFLLESESRFPLEIFTDFLTGSVDWNDNSFLHWKTSQAFPLEGQQLNFTFYFIQQFQNQHSSNQSTPIKRKTLQKPLRIPSSPMIITFASIAHRTNCQTPRRT